MAETERKEGKKRSKKKVRRKEKEEKTKKMINVKGMVEEWKI